MSKMIEIINQESKNIPKIKKNRNSHLLEKYQKMNKLLTNQEENHIRKLKIEFSDQNFKSQQIYFKFIIFFII
jgi:hypothetical protein